MPYEYYKQEKTIQT